MITAIVALSGGMDSATVLAKAEAAQRRIETVGFRYGSKHNEFENTAAREIAKYYKVPFQLIDLSIAMKGFKSNLLLGGGKIPEGHYDDESMSKTVVPCRNIIFISILAGLAESIEASEIWLGIHSGDYAIYPDCRPKFYSAMKQAIEEGSGGKVTLRAPFLYSNKRIILDQGISMKVPYQLTRTCYKNQELACGVCGSCQERLEAFAFLKMKDPITYEGDVDAQEHQSNTQG